MKTENNNLGMGMRQSECSTSVKCEALSFILGTTENKTGGIKRPQEQLGRYAALVASARSSSCPHPTASLSALPLSLFPLFFPLSLPLPICLLLFFSIHSFLLCCVWCPWRLDKGTRSLRTGVTDDCKSTHGFTPEPSLQQPYGVISKKANTCTYMMVWSRCISKMSVQNRRS